MTVLHTPPQLPLPARPTPMPGEAFTGYLLRLGDFYGTTLLGVIDELGLMGSDRPALAPTLIEDLPPDLRELAATRLRLDPAAIEAMSIAAVAQAVGPAGDGVISAHEWRYRHHTPYCPVCMAEHPGVWRLDWQWPYAAVCPRHRVALVGECPGCHRRPFLRWGSGSTRAGVLVQAAKCMNAAADVRPKSGLTCGFDLACTETVPASGLDVAARSIIGAALAGMPIRCHHGISGAGDFLADVRGAVLLAMIGRCEVDLGGSTLELQRAAVAGAQRRRVRSEPMYVVKKHPPEPVEVAALITMAVGLFAPLEV